MATRARRVRGSSCKARRTRARQPPARRSPPRVRPRSHAGEERPAKGRSRSSAYPQTRLRWLHGVVHRLEELTTHRVEVDLIAQSLAELVERARRIVAGVVEPSVYGDLHARAQGLEESEADERGPSDGKLVPAREWTKERLEQDDAPKEGGADHRCRATVDECAIDEHIDVVEPIAEDRDACGDRDTVQSERPRS